MDQWFAPEILAEEQWKTRQALPSTLGCDGDFGSYAKANRGDGLATSGIESHNLVHTRGRVAQYARILNQRTFSRIADIGCGLGMTTNALAQQFPGARVVGFEVSTDAVEFARRTFPVCQFIEMAISPDVPLGENFDLILCQEFYPFTRTGDFDVHRAFVNHFIKYLAPGGALLIELSERNHEQTILASLDNLGMPTRVCHLPFDKINRNLPIYNIARMISWLMARVFSRPRNTCAIIHK